MSNDYSPGGKGFAPKAHGIRGPPTARAKAPESLTIVIPVFNEETSISACVQGVRDKNPRARILIVDDGSTDRTASGLGAVKDHQVQVIRHELNMGYGAALKTGFREARTPLIGFLDADLTYDPSLFTPMAQLLIRRGLDSVWADRFHGRTNEMVPWRRLGNRLIGILFRMAAPGPLSDCTSGHRLFTREALDRMGIDDLPDGFDFIGTLSTRAIRMGLRCGSLPTDYRKRRGRSKLNEMTDFVRIARAIILERMLHPQGLNRPPEGGDRP